ncbi:MAG: hypothetical protein L3J08_07125 [Flavobacteriaceae bacterium]|nr:hypothetical protein [Flavobacteriaceae bacterium]
MRHQTIKKLNQTLLVLLLIINYTVLAQQIENHTKGELEIKVTPFGLKGNEINVGKVLEDGTIHFNWPEINVNSYNGSEFFMSSIKKVVGMDSCEEKQIDQNNDSIKIVNTESLFLYKYGQPVGLLYPATQKELENNAGSNRTTSLVLGSMISWFYSNGDVTFKAKCTVNQEWENSYNFKKVTNYELNFKKGWNIVQHTLLEKEDWKSDTDQGSLPKTISKKTMMTIPSNINWYLEYWANDEYLEIEHQLLKQTPITKKQFENWIPKYLSSFNRTDYEIGKKLERITITNTANLIFEKGLKKIDITIIDCAGSAEGAKAYTAILSVLGTEWKENSSTGYQSSTKMDDIPVLIEYKKGKITTLDFNSNGRFLIHAKGNEMKPDELWSYLKKLDIEKLSK